MSEDPTRPPPPAPEKPRVEGGDRDVATDQQPPSGGSPSQESSEGGMRGEERGEHDPDRKGGMGGEGF